MKSQPINEVSFQLLNPEFNALVLGMVEGLTEFLPISSTGHLIIASNYLNFQDIGHSFKIVIQLGAILAAFWHFYPVIAKMILGLLNIKNKNANHDANSNQQYRQLALKFMLALVPSSIIGYLLFDNIQRMLSSVEVVATALITGGFAIILIEAYWNNKNKPKNTKQNPQASNAQANQSKKTKLANINLVNITYKQAFLIGVGQIIAMIPGASRSAATIVTARLCGIKTETSAQFSFILAIPTIAGASLLTVIKTPALWQSEQQVSYIIIGFITAFCMAKISLSFFFYLINKFSLTLFGCYRIILGTIVLLL